jgi:hypothetical protein
VINREPAHLTDILSALFRHFANSNDAGVHKACLQGMCFFLSRRPDLLPAFVPTIRSTLGAPGTSSDTQGAQLQLIRALSDFVKSEQERTEQLQLNVCFLIFILFLIMLIDSGKCYHVDRLDMSLIPTRTAKWLRALNCVKRNQSKSLVLCRFPFSLCSAIS